MLRLMCLCLAEQYDTMSEDCHQQISDTLRGKDVSIQALVVIKNEEQVSWWTGIVLYCYSSVFNEAWQEGKGNWG